MFSWKWHKNGQVVSEETSLMPVRILFKWTNQGPFQPSLLKIVLVASEEMSTVGQFMDRQQTKDLQ